MGNVLLDLCLVIFLRVLVITGVSQAISNIQPQALFDSALYEVGEAAAIHGLTSFQR